MPGVCGTSKAENGKLKRLLAEAHLDNAALQDVSAESGEAGRQRAGGGAPGPGARSVRAPGLPAAALNLSTWQYGVRKQERPCRRTWLSS